ncbi:hypothetical protein [Flavobacterium coralii]|uniref:hypothetical protein n=1 Tax=Flavobacterium coralii TaxID=2838017 RepID=UPI000C4366B9|nr:hypothetical protein [Flavobacterium sp.]|tara:strand:+ start:73905 stop:76622 length:2718 start_codon:yes stop_codon:yes gene_type:complete
MIIINDLNESRFTLNGVQYFKNYFTRVAGNSLSIYNAYNTCDVLVPFSPHERFQVNGSLFEAVEELQAALVGICYTRNTLNEGSPADQNNIGRVISFGELLPQNGLYITREEASAKINSLAEPITISAKDSPVNFTFTREGKMYGFEFLGGKGIWGSTSGSEVFPHQFLLKTLYDITPEDITGETSGATIISLGEVPDGNFLAAANSSQRDFSDSGIADEDGTIKSYYFTYTNDSVLNFVQFVGEAGVYNGNITTDDLVSSTNSKASPIIDYEGVLQYGKVAVSPARHQDRLTGMITEFNGSGFKSIKNEAAQTFKIAEPTGNHEVVFPPANQNDSIVYASQLQNEVNNYLPLTGTADGNPITGNIEVEESTSIFHDNGFYTSGIIVEDGGVNLYGYDTTGISCYLRFNQGGTGISFSSNSSTSRGIRGQQDFTHNITALDYTQKKYVDELVGTTIPLTGTATGNPITGDIVIDATNTIGLKASVAGEITFDNTQGIAISSDEGIRIDSGAGGLTISGTFTTIENSPLGYAEDLSSNYNERSLVDKAYVDNIATNITFQEVLEAGSEAVLISSPVTIQTDNGINAKGSIGLNNSGVSIGGQSGGVSISGGNDGLVLNQLNSISAGNTADIIITAANGGIKYSNNPIEGYTDRSLVDKEYVDNLVTSGTGFGFWNNTEISWLEGTSEEILFADGTFADIGEKVRSQQIGEDTGTDTNITTTTSLQSAVWSLQAQLNTANSYTEELETKTTQILLNKAYSNIVLTGNTSETILTSVLINAGTLQEGVLQIAALFEKTGIAGNIYHRIYVNTIDSLTGAVRIASLNSTSNARPFTAFCRDFLLRNNTIYGFPELTSSFDGVTDTVGTPLNATLNISQNFYIIIAGVLQSADDTLYQKSLKITFEKFTA